MKKIGLCICLLSFLFPCLIMGQNNKKAIELLEKSAAVFQQSNGIEASFLLKDGMSDPKSIHSFEGTLKSKSNKFVIDLPDMQTWFDGKTQWSFLKSNQEVNITSPTSEEIAAINPVALLRLYKNGYRPVYKGERTVDSNPVAEIELVADKAQLPWRKIFIRLDTRTNLPVSVLIRDKNGRNTDIHFLKIKQNLNFSDSIFVFKKEQFPNVEIIDLR